MTALQLQAMSDEFQKLSQEGIVRRTVRRAQVASEFAEPPAEAALGFLAAKGLGAKSPKRLLAAGGAGLVHGVYRKTKKYAG